MRELIEEIAGLAEIISLLVTIAGLATLLPLIGLDGAAVTSLVAYTVSMGVMLLRTRAALDVRMRSLLVPTAGDLPALMGAMSGAGGPLRRPS